LFKPAKPVVPALWTPPFGEDVSVDFALGEHADGWTRHAVWGDPSFDTFRRIRKEPFHYGAPPYEWPVTGFLFEDPVSGNWYAYVGLYPWNYAFEPGKPVATCTTYRSTDRGATWEHLGPVFPDRTFRFEGDPSTANLTPDVCVVYDDGLYHMVYDWCNDEVTWDNLRKPTRKVDGGVAYAWAESPEGPWHRHETPMIRNTWMKAHRLLGKYDRAYATALVRRRSDWLALVGVDAGPYRSWAVTAMTARDPRGPWTEPVLILSPESDTYFPPIIEIFPVFCHDGYIYAPGDALGANHTFQLIPRAPIEEAHRPEAWEIYQHGCAWHAEDVPHEARGIFGQTFSGSVDADGQLNALFCTCDAKDIGSVNVASRPWDTPIRSRGFHLAAHKGPALTYTRCAFEAFALEARLNIRSEAKVLWGCHAPVSSDRSTHDSTLHPLALGSHQALELSKDAWRVTGVDATRTVSVIAEGVLPSAHERTISVKLDRTGEFKLVLDGQAVWSGGLPIASGPLGLLVEPGNHLEVTGFVVTGRPLPAEFNYLYMEAFLGAGLLVSEWDTVTSSAFRFGVGAVRREPGGRAKWNFRGSAFTLWSPRGPEYGRIQLRLDGQEIAEIDLHAESPAPSQPVYTWPKLDDVYHALVMEGVSGRMILDSLQVID